MRFRNHFSSILEELGSGIVLLATLAVLTVGGNLSALFRSDKSLRQLLGSHTFLVAAAALLAIIAVIIMHIWRWSKTYISLKDNTIVIERETLNQKKNIIGIKNISNINTEQNVFEMLMGTSKVKIDTNSYSTANSNDVKIILKKAQALAFKEEVLRLIQGEGSGTAPAAEAGQLRSDPLRAQTPSAMARETYDVTTTPGEMLEHGIFSANLYSVLLVLVGASTLFLMVLDILEKKHSAAATVLDSGFLGAVVLLLLLFFGGVWSIIRGFLKHYDFCAARRGDKLFIKYGLLKKVSYSIPVDKINGLKIKQTALARLFKRYRVEIINVGMGDESTEEDSFLLLYCKLDKLKEQLQLLLPEVDLNLEGIRRQPVQVWKWWGIQLFGEAILSVILVAVSRQIMGAALWQHFYLLAIGAGAAVMLVMLAVYWLSYITSGTVLEETGLVAVNGYLARQYTFMTYDKIQFIRAKQNFITRRDALVKGELFLLASLGSSLQELAFIDESAVEFIKTKL